MNALEVQLKALMQAGLSGDRAAYACLLDLSGRRLRFYFARRIGHDAADLEDLVQDTLIAIHQRRASYDERLPFTVWLHAIARYKLVDHFRRSHVRRSSSIEDIDDPIAEDVFGPALAGVDLEKLLAHLSESQTMAIRLTQIEGLSVAEVSSRTGQSESAVKVNTHRGIKKLMALVRGEKSDG